MKLSRLLVTLSGALMFSFASASNADTLKPFPVAEEGSVRYVIELPELSDESTVKVQLIAGKTIEVDCNRQSFGGNFAEESVEGWGYNYYNISELTGPMTTLMACADDTKHEAFVAMQDSPLVRYNSKLPIVIYAPEDVTVKYRVWQANVLDNEATSK